MDLQPNILPNRRGLGIERVEFANEKRRATLRPGRNIRSDSFLARCIKRFEKVFTP